MNDISPDAILIRITPDGICFIGDEYFTPPPGVTLNEAVLAHLQLEAAALEMPIRAVIQDEQAHYTTSIQINTDGTSHPSDDEAQVPAAPSLSQTTAAPTPLPTSQPHTANPVPANRPYEPLPEPYRGRLAAICATANQNLFAEASRDGDQLLAELSAQFGPSHPYTLAAGLVRGDIAWLNQDFRFAMQSWVFMARAWHLHLGPQHSTTVRAAGNALGCWRRLQPAEAKELAPYVITFLRDISFPDRDAAVRTINRRVQRIALSK
ncbi:hypothetical protein PV387_10430 [Streptomyces sp. ME02-6987-2C]|uniref:hypothetical protein n=1 Tax=unclassified Streptomyces TaxID=2593676 RepID=UPI00087AEDCA|nr:MULTISPECIES: hypothetical protein [unclassified Streptomyces]MDX3366443.1 hypothetical protein [Streptomyces sp. ME02-6987-2C]MDX3423734.1 hypothetical protein [Streptomyces sp. ME02-6985-2c]REH20632.1 hypothetical protein BX268_2416 [Streptomyces sp. 2221.1]SDT30783.1 hypothetical protein SAMN05428941_2411 [Streptomyces sp. 2114.2]